MEHHNQGMDREMTVYLKKIATSISLVLLWLLVLMTAGLRFRLAIVEDDGMHWYNFLFYGLLLLSAAFMGRWLWRNWKDKEAVPS